jgi:hypothetical protein
MWNPWLLRVFNKRPVQHPYQHQQQQQQQQQSFSGQSSSREAKENRSLQPSATAALVATFSRSEPGGGHADIDSFSITSRTSDYQQQQQQQQEVLHKSSAQQRFTRLAAGGCPRR